jgi:hypothetical protein
MAETAGLARRYFYAWQARDVRALSEVRSTVASPTPTANWSHVENGRIQSIQVAFDPREIVSGRP